MAKVQGDLELLQSPTAQALLSSTNVAHLSYIWTDGTPRVVPVWFFWNGEEIILGSPALAPKVQVLRQNKHVALSIDSTVWPYKVLMIRGEAEVSLMDQVPEEYQACSLRYFGAEAGAAWNETVSHMGKQARIAIKPSWVGTLEFEARFPSAIAAALAGAN